MTPYDEIGLARLIGQDAQPMLKTCQLTFLDINLNNALDIQGLDL